MKSPAKSGTFHFIYKNRILLLNGLDWSFIERFDMLIKKGSTRIAILFPRIGIVVKVPNIYLRSAYSVLRHSLFQFWYCFGWKIALKDAFGTHPDMRYRILWHLFGGMYHNWSEFVFFCKTRHGFCQPTYFSLAGLVNIQKYGEHIPEDLDWIGIFWPHIASIVRGMPSDGHHWASDDNYTRVGSKLRLLDYGSRVTRYILLNRRAQLEALEI